jgi:hypothetical protein
MDVSKKSFGQQMLAPDTTLEKYIFLVTVLCKVFVLEQGKFFHD